MGLPTRRYHKIRSLEVTGGGFLGGLNLNFSDGLNCVIGGRGAGKTTILEFLRYALEELPNSTHARSHRQAIETLVERNLNGGRIRVGIETQDGLVYHVERSAGEEQAEVLDASDEPTLLSLSQGGLFGAEIYSQNEIERIADNPNFQLDLIDGFREEEISEINRKLRRLDVALRNNARDTLTLGGQIEELERAISELPLVTERLERVFLNADQQPSADMEQELRLKALRDQEQRFVRRVTEGFADNEQAVERLRHDTRAAFGRLSSERFKQGPNGAVFSELEKVVEDLQANLNEILGSALHGLAHGSESVEQSVAELQQAHRTQERRYQELLQVHDSERERAEERLKLQRRQSELLEQQRELEARRQGLAAARERRQELITQLQTLRDRRTALREEVVVFLNERLSPEIRVSLEPAKDRSAYRQLLLDAFQGARRPYRAQADSVSRALLPEILVQIVRDVERDYLAQCCKLSDAQASWILERLNNPGTLLALEAVELGDVPRIELLDGDYKDAPRLSTGQKCTTILPILLLENEKPLLIDEPEGNLDNAFVYSTIVKKIRAVKPARQLIFVTHNPNIPVLGDAEQVVVLSSSGRRAEVVASGGVDAAKDHVERILEGGREAFEERRKRYGH